MQKVTVMQQNDVLRFPLRATRGSFICLTPVGNLDGRLLVQKGLLLLLPSEKGCVLGEE